MNATVPIYQGRPVVKKPTTPKDDEPKMGKQKAIRFTNETLDELEWIGSQLGLDISALVRLIINENLAPYRAKADAVYASKKKLPNAEKE